MLETFIIKAIHNVLNMPIFRYCNVQHGMIPNEPELTNGTNVY